MTERRPQLLEDAQIHQFVVNGFVAVRPAALSADFHRSIKDELDVLLEAGGNPGNSLLPRIPQLQSMLDDPAVAGAVQSLCGRDALLHPHRYVHARGSDDDPANVGQSWHKVAPTLCRCFDNHARLLNCTNAAAAAAAAMQDDYTCTTRPRVTNTSSVGSSCSVSPRPLRPPAAASCPMLSIRWSGCAAAAAATAVTSDYPEDVTLDMGPTCILPGESLSTTHPCVPSVLFLLAHLVASDRCAWMGGFDVHTGCHHLQSISHCNPQQARRRRRTSSR